MGLPNLTKKIVSIYARLRILIRAIENDNDLTIYSEVERDVLCAAIDLATSSPSFRAASIVSHPIFQSSSKATIYRAIKSLEEKGVLRSIEVDGRNLFCLSID